MDAADTVIYASTATSDGIDGVSGARRPVEQFRHSRARISATST
jgi:chromosome partitioning protein